MPRSEAAPALAWPAAYTSVLRHAPAWLAERQAQARTAFEALEMPTWRRGRGWSLAPGPLELERYTPAATGAAVSDATPVLGGPGAILTDGVLTALSKRFPDGVEAIPLGSAGLDILPAAAAAWLGAVVGPDAGKLEALNLAALTGGIVLRVRAGAHVTTPLRIRHLVQGAQRVSLPRVVVVVEEGAQATVLEEVSDPTGGGTVALMNGVTEILLGDAARLHYIDVTELGPDATGIGHRRARLGRDSRLEWTTGVFGGGFLSLSWDSELAGPGARVDSTGVYLSGGREQHALTSDTWHRAPSTEADVQFRGAVFGHTGSVFDGIIRTDKTAKGTVSHLGDHLLFLSRHARADSIPSLLIEGDDVKVGHGATIGRVDPNQIFYMGARGIDPDRAREMLVLGYFEPTLARIPDEALRETQRATIRRRVLENAREAGQ